ncbi:hypothetical protein TNIN_385511 [Trichonephila inaurata madagascariensis]|uniref:Uncharacterized protein n=1 Tax=Trichonephila inaurata madagascariensis TaxID=2747483 RepID=A0A8X6YD33_9ARAC|nr:hypothetical protein TNIN_385511 [Trichonephila inaurata madagascariensis]
MRFFPSILRFITYDAYFPLDVEFNHLARCAFMADENAHSMRPHGDQYSISVQVWAGGVRDLLVLSYLFPGPVTSADYVIFLHKSCYQFYLTLCHNESAICSVDMILKFRIMADVCVNI